MKSITEAALAKFWSWRSDRARYWHKQLTKAEKDTASVISGYKDECRQYFNYEFEDEQFDSDFESAIGSTFESSTVDLLSTEPARPTKRKRAKKVAAPKPRVRATAKAKRPTPKKPNAKAITKADIARSKLRLIDE